MNISLKQFWWCDAYPFHVTPVNYYIIDDFFVALEDLIPLKILFCSK